MKTEMIRCDNPACRSIVDEEGRYGWLAGTLSWIGPGPTIEVEVCTIACLQPGTEAARARYRDEYGEEARQWHLKLEKATLETECEFCNAGAGEPCVSGKGNVKQGYHAGRRDEGMRIAREQQQ